MLRPYSIARVAGRKRSGRSEVDRRQAASGLQLSAASHLDVRETRGHLVSAGCETVAFTSLRCESRGATTSSAFVFQSVCIKTRGNVTTRGAGGHSGKPRAASRALRPGPNPACTASVGRVRHGLPRAAGPGLTYPVGRTATERAALKRPCSARLTSRSECPPCAWARTGARSDTAWTRRVG